MNTFFDALRECIGWDYNHTQSSPQSPSNLEEYATFP